MMKIYHIPLLVILILFSGCEDPERAKELRLMEIELGIKERDARIEEKRKRRNQNNDAEVENTSLQNDLAEYSDVFERLNTGNPSLDALLQNQAKKAIKEFNLQISQNDLSVFMYKHFKENWATEIEDGGIDLVSIEVMKLNEDLLQINTSRGTASSNRFSLLRKTNNHYSLLNTDEALKPVFAKVSTKTAVIRDFQGASFETIDGKQWMVFYFYDQSDPHCCKSIKVATIGQLDSYNRFKTDGLMYFREGYSSYWESL
ncbi:hypothetical protein NMK71_05070 [Weeksellaceae bacterium KMM 9713]|uniref:Lipoprotein n=1 Tax=Profundicola chukchiensis TaxID=2961959 RepID=A0A9X4RU52_9FLAO|nr:hypothetical protein [Profundicola chukchiensis]MDG4945778.1 hypothetical protein [Profundicola chukchiensis]